MRYTPQDELTAPARPSAHPARLLAGVILTTALFLVLSSGFSAILQILIGPTAWQALAPALQTGTTPVAVLINLLIFGLLIMALAATLRVAHRRTLASLLGPFGTARRQFGRVAAALVVLLVVIVFLPIGNALRPVPNMAFGLWLLFLPVGLLAVLIQTTAEEMAFRGYLQSQLAARFRHPLIWMGVPSALFALLHLDPSAHGDNTWLVVIWAGCFGLAAADLTARSGTLAPAIALHFVNNLNAILIAAPKGYFDGLALYVYPFSLQDTAAVWAWFPADLLMLGCGWLAARVALRR